MSASRIGEFQYLVLLALARLGENAYGMSVRQDLEQRAQRPISIGAVYSTLDRLEQKGLVTSRFGDPTPERGGRAKRFFRVTAAGAEVVRDYRSMLQRLGALVPAERPTP